MAGGSAPHNPPPMSWMTNRRLHLCLPEPMRSDATAGRVNIANRIAAAIRPLDWQVEIRSEGERLREGHVLRHMREPDGPQELCLTLKMV